MRVCVITNGFPFACQYAYERQCEQLLRMLYEMQHECHVVNLAWLPSSPSPAIEIGAAPWVFRVEYHRSPVSEYPCRIPPEAFAGAPGRPWDVIVTLCDVVHFGAGTWPCPALCWYPCHYMRPTRDEAAALRCFDLVVPMTHDGRGRVTSALLGEGRCCSEPIPNVVQRPADRPPVPPPKTVQPVTQAETQAESKAGPFTFLCVAMNYEPSQRKGHAHLLAAFRMYMNMGGDGVLKLHAPGNAHGVDLAAVMTSLDLPADRVHIQDKLVTDAELLSLYDACHVVVVPSKAEGFGIPAVEAQLAARPVIVTEYGAMAEVVRCGVRVPPATVEWNVAQQGFWPVPDVKGLATAMLQVQGSYEEHYELARAHASDTAALTSYDRVKGLWEAALLRVTGTGTGTGTGTATAENATMNSQPTVNCKVLTRVNCSHDGPPV